MIFLRCVSCMASDKKYKIRFKSVLSVVMLVDASGKLKLGPHSWHALSWCCILPLASAMNPLLAAPMWPLFLVCMFAASADWVYSGHTLLFFFLLFRWRLPSFSTVLASLIYGIASQASSGGVRMQILVEYIAVLRWEVNFLLNLCGSQLVIYKVKSMLSTAIHCFVSG